MKRDEPSNLNEAQQSTDSENELNGESLTSSEQNLDDDVNTEASDALDLIDDPEFTDALVEFSLDDLGRAYAAAVGLAPKDGLAESAESQIETPDPVEMAALDDAPCPLSPKSILEAILFMGSPNDIPLTTKKLASLMRDVSIKELNALIDELNAAYAEAQAAFRIEVDKQNVQLVLVEEMEPIRQKFYGEVRLAKLTQSAIDVLSIVAYNQPISAREVDRLRTYPSAAVLNQLVKRQLLTTITDETNPRTKLYQTTDRFLELFGLSSLSDLPRAESEIDLF
ncbi:MAG TPA: SMC-Scp complex subunit ScpB [Pirellulaceae bacterium]|nr:SMC-Scp complex subunit ScpB [Pirellulaceae bacterium]HMO90709.1 SMC-Scp complex subunit ScpB [Pirellulaceae bacterium]HMP71085.1 SMC-Scp complex subunit ScpB [Pirellulaceae bacterium]